MKPRIHKNRLFSLAAALVLLIFICFIFDSFEKAESACNYPEIIREWRLEGLYDKAIVDWYIINTAWWGSGDYLIVYDEFADSLLIHCDTLSGFMTLDKSLTRTYEKMKSILPENVYKYEEIHLDIPDFVDGVNFYGDTILLTLFPEVLGDEYMLDLTGGYVYNLYYLEEELVRIGANDYIEVDITPQIFPRDSLWSICRGRFIEEQGDFNDWWNCQFLKVIE